MTVVSTAFTRSKIVEKQIPYLAALEKTDAGYLEYLAGTLARGTGRDGAPLSDERRRYLEQQARDVRLEEEELGGARLVVPALTFEQELRIHLGAREVRVAFLGPRQHGGRRGRHRSRRAGRGGRGSAGEPDSLRLRLPSVGLDPDPRGADRDRRRRDRSRPRAGPARLELRAESLGPPRRDRAAGRRTGASRAPRSSRRSRASISRARGRASPARASSGARRSTTSSCAPPSIGRIRRRRARWPRSRAPERRRAHSRSVARRASTSAWSVGGAP